MAYCALDARRRRAEFFRDLGIQHLGDGIDYIHVVYRKYYRLAQVLIALYVRRNADLVDDLGDCRFEICVARARRQKHLLLTRQRADLADAIQKRGDIARLRHEIRRSECRALTHYLVSVQMCNDDRLRAGACLGQAAQHLDTVELQKHQIHHQHIRLPLGRKGKRFNAVVGIADALHVILL